MGLFSKREMNRTKSYFIKIFMMLKFLADTQVHGQDNGYSPSGNSGDDFNWLINPYDSFSSTTPDNDYNLEDVFQLGTEYCNEKASCSDLMFLTFPEKLCHCDKLCGFMSDCCSNYAHESVSYLTKDLFECVPLYELVKNLEYGVSMVTKCPSEWSNNVTRELCESETDEENIFLRLPVSDKTEFHVMYRNMYCAQCNNILDFYFWKQEIKCRNETGVRSLPEMEDCEKYFIRPVPEISYRTCQLSQPIISSCNTSEESISYNLVKNCTDGIYAITFDQSGKMYRNKYCAICNGVSENLLLCDQLNVSPDLLFPPPTSGEKATYSLRVIVDFNSNNVEINGVVEHGKQCGDNEIYDAASQICREIFCAPPLIPADGLCNKTTSRMVGMFNKFPDSVIPQENCSWIKLESQEYEFTNNSELYILSHKKVYTTGEYLFNGADVFICLNKTETCVNGCDAKPVYFSDIVESYLTLVGLIVSIISLAITLAVYVSFPQLLNVPGKILASLIVSLLLAQILFISAPEVQNVSTLCTIFAIFVHYFFLSAFCWMNVIAFDLWMTFSNRFVTPGSDTKGRKKFIRYSIYAWLLPVVIVCPAIILDFVDFDDNFSSLKPSYGKGVCWISSKNALILFLAGPLALFKILDIVSFISTAIHIARAKKEGAMATRRTNTCSFIINIKLSLIMGLTWVFAFVANATNEDVMWYLFIIFNSLQGLFIAICYLCTKKVGRLLGDKYQQITTRYTSSTQTTSVP